MPEHEHPIGSENGCISVHVRCALCVTVSDEIIFEDWDVGEASAIPEGWAMLNVVLPHPVLSKDMEGMAEAIRSITGVKHGALAAYADGMCRWLEANSPAFHTTLYVCPKCIQAKAQPWDEIQKRLLHSTERDDQEDEDLPHNVSPFPDRTT